MPAKDPEQRRATVRAWYARNKEMLAVRDRERRKAWRHSRRLETAVWFSGLKDTLACRRCGENHPAVLQFHHSNPNAKEIMITDAVRSGWSRKRILAEASKCEVLCANCHAKHHAAERSHG